MPWSAPRVAAGLFLLVACACAHDEVDRGAPAASSAPPAPEPSASAWAAPVVVAPASAEPMPAPRSCVITSPEERRRLLDCIGPAISGRVGHVGAYTVRVALGEDGRMHSSGRVLSTDACDAAARALAAHGPCTWDVRGPFPEWTVRVVTK